MKLSDLIIEHGPYETRLDAVRAGVLVGVAADALNELREELMAARAVREQRFDVRGVASCEDAQLWVTCGRCGDTSGTTWVFDEPQTLAELNRRAGEHAEVCR